MHLDENGRLLVVGLICTEDPALKLIMMIPDLVGQICMSAGALRTECVYWLVLESQLPPKIVNLLFTVTCQNVKLTCGAVEFIKLVNNYITSEELHTQPAFPITQRRAPPDSPAVWSGRAPSMETIRASNWSYTLFIPRVERPSTFFLACTTHVSRRSSRSLWLKRLG